MSTDTRDVVKQYGPERAEDDTILPLVEEELAKCACFHNHEKVWVPIGDVRHLVAMTREAYRLRSQLAEAVEVLEEIERLPNGHPLGNMAAPGIAASAIARIREQS